MGPVRVTFQWFAEFLYVFLMTLRKKSLALGSTVTLAGGATGASLLAMLLAASPAGAVGTTYTVDTLADGASNSSDCITPVPGSCSLRDAVDAATDGDTIVFASGLTGTITLNAGEMDFNAEFTLQGPGADLLTVDAAGSSRVFYMCTGSAAAEIAGITITGGSDSMGGGLYDECDDGFTLRDVVVTGNEATSGGGGGFYSGGSVTLINTVVSNNTATTFGGGGVSDDLTMVGSTISGNTSGAGGGGAFAKGNASITTSTFDNNTAADCGGGLYSKVDNGTVTITDSTFSNNSADNCYGGAIDIDNGYNTVLIANTTITGNSAVSGGGLHLYGYNAVTLAQNTIVGNNATSTDALYSGGGLHFEPLGLTLEMSGTIVSGNTAAAGPADIGIGSSNTVSGAITANDSLLGDVDSRLAVNGSGNVSAITPGVGALADNGGPTKTRALLADSAALDAGPATVATFPGNAYDQRGAGFARVVGTRADIGAFEIQAEPPATTTTVTPDEPVAPAFTG